MSLREDDQPDAAMGIEAYRRSFEGITLLANQLPEDDIRTIARQIVANLNTSLKGRNAQIGLPTPDEIEALCDALIGTDEDRALQMILQARREGVELETVYIHYLGEAARRLGARWDDDRVSFADVTIGTGRIFAIMTALRAHFPAARQAAGQVALFATVPGEEHRLGVAMATDLFRDAGWHIESLSGKSSDDILAAARNLGPAFVGLSASAERSLPALAQVVIALKIALPETLILVSGPIVDIAGEVVAKLGADFVTADLAEARKLLDAATRPAP